MRMWLFLLLTLMPFAAFGAEPSTPPAEISDGSRIEFADKGFSIAPPNGWEIHRDIPNLTLLLQVPNAQDLPYQRNITVRKANGAHAIDDYAADEFSKLIVERRARLLPGVVNYRLRNHETVDLANGGKGLLFYAQFELNMIPMMEMHLIASTADHHFILTFTDVAENFDTSNSLPYLDEAFKSITSIQTDTTSKARFDFLTKLLGVLVAGGLLFFLIRKSTTRGLAQNDGAEHESDAPESLSGSSHSQSFSVDDETSSVESDDDLEYMQVSAEAADESEDGDWAEDDAGADDEPWQKSSPPPIPSKIRKKRAG